MNNLEPLLWTYWDNSEKWHGKKLFTVEAKTIVEADAAFTKKIGVNPQKVSTIGVQQESIPCQA